MSDKEPIHRKNALGDIEAIDPDTGEVLWTQARKKIVKNGKVVRRSSPGRGRRSKSESETHHYVKDERGETLWVPIGTNPDTLPRETYPYSQVTVNHILQLITEGDTIRSIGRMKDMPSASVIHRWLREHKDFQSQMKEARKARAEHFHDLVFETALNAKKKTIQEDRLKVEAFKWGAQVGDPDAYGNKTKVSGDPDAPIAFLIDTGIRRGSDPGAPQNPSVIETEGKEVSEEDGDALE